VSNATATPIATVNASTMAGRFSDRAMTLLAAPGATATRKAPTSIASPAWIVRQGSAAAKPPAAVTAPAIPAAVGSAAAPASGRAAPHILQNAADSDA
jgi:hypothetical protein